MKVKDRCFAIETHHDSIYFKMVRESIHFIVNSLWREKERKREVVFNMLCIFYRQTHPQLNMYWR